MEALMDAEHVLREAMERLLTQLEALGDESYLGLARLLYQRAALPGSYVTMVGETSSGKSTLANVLLGQKLLPTAARPTAGTVTHVRCLAENAITYLAINRDGTQERIDRAVFEKLSREPDESLLRLEVRARPMDANLLGLNLFDTPGYNSLIYGHEEALRAFLPQSDAIIYVVSHRVGVGESDQHLFELLGGVRQADPELPVLVVVNRAPATVTKESRRAREIRSHVDDCLRGPFSFHVIGTADPGPAEGEVLRVPGLEVVWKEVREIVLSEGRRTAVVARPRPKSSGRRSGARQNPNDGGNVGGATRVAELAHV
jgi:GTPase SAR1 family protein